MAAKEPVVLVVLVEAAKLRWSVAAIALDGVVTPLVRSEDGDLATYQGLGFDDQVSFLRHRFCGVFQRGCDRLWPVGRKACQFAIVFDDHLPGTTAELTHRVADHFVEWMLNPPVVVYMPVGTTGFASQLDRFAGSIDPPLEQTLFAAQRALFALADDATVWDVSHRKGTWAPGQEKSEAAH